MSAERSELPQPMTRMSLWPVSSGSASGLSCFHSPYHSKACPCYHFLLVALFVLQCRDGPWGGLKVLSSLLCNTYLVASCLEEAIPELNRTEILKVFREQASEFGFRHDVVRLQISRSVGSSTERNFLYGATAALHALKVSENGLVKSCESIPMYKLPIDGISCTEGIHTINMTDALRCQDACGKLGHMSSEYSTCDVRMLCSWMSGFPLKGPLHASEFSSCIKGKGGQPTLDLMYM